MTGATIFIISDGTGETASSMVRAALVQYQDVDISVVRCKNVRTEDQIESLMVNVAQRKGFVVYTVVSKQLGNKIREVAGEKGISAIDLLGPLLTGFDAYFGKDSGGAEAGKLRMVDDRYFKRIEAIEYTVKHDDGKTLSYLDQADIVLVGISRTSKTPLSIFLSHKGWKVANIPLVLDQPLPKALFEIDQRKVVGLIIDEESLYRIRRKRLEKFGQDPGNTYASMSYISKEIQYALSLYKKNRRWPVFNVTDRALEETAGEIIRVVASRMDLPYDALL